MKWIILSCVWSAGAHYVIDTHTILSLDLYFWVAQDSLFASLNISSFTQKYFDTNEKLHMLQAHYKASYIQRNNFIITQPWL